MFLQHAHFEFTMMWKVVCVEGESVEGESGEEEVDTESVWKIATYNITDWRD